MLEMNSLPLPLRWLPALVVMGLIFTLSSLPADVLPDYGPLDFLLKKGAHAIGYALLASAYFYALPPRLSPGYKAVLALLMAVLFALSDEFHQSFVQGRTSSLRDVAIDTMGGLAGLGVSRVFHSSNSSSNSAP
jgi:VanZ family protein